MPIPWSVGAILTPRCINLVLQRPLFSDDVCPGWWIQHCPDAVEILLEVNDTWCMKLVPFPICPMQCGVNAASRIFDCCKPLFGDPKFPWHFWDPCWALWHFMYDFDDIWCIAGLLQRPHLDHLLMWFWPTIVIGLHCGLWWVARTHEIIFLGDLDYCSALQ